jgi:hypothetical protein
MSKSKEENVKRPNNVKRKVTETVSTTARIVKNAEHFVQAVSLLVLAGFAYTQLKTVQSDVVYYTVLAALIVVGLRGAVEFISFLKKENK